MPSPETGLRGVPRVMLWIAGVALTVMMLVVVADVVLRAAFNTPIRGAYDLVSYALLIMVYFGMAPVVARRSEILIDLVDQILPPVALRVLKLVASVGTLALFVFLGWSMIAPARDAWRWGEYSLELGLPVWALWALAFIGLAGILWAAAVRVWRALTGRTDSVAETARDEEGGL